MDYQILKIDSHDDSRGARSVLIIYTGGTLGMAHDEQGTLQPFNFGKIIEEMPVLKKMDIALSVISFPKLIDSSNMNIIHWNELGRIIKKYYEDYDGFVIIHGTDTMAYSASALSFMLQGLAKPVIFTGAQLPMGAVRTDAGQNLIAALQIASAQREHGPVIKEVCIYFDYLLLRGNRSKKVESVHFDVFESENYPPLAEAGISIEFNFPVLLGPPDQEFKVHKMKATTIALIKLFPGLENSVLDHIIATPGLQGVILETFGSGNAPTTPGFKQALKKAIAAGIPCYNVSQCDGGRVLQGRYSTSKHLLDMGVVSGADITTEAALAKMQFLLSNETNYDQIIRQLSNPMRGEMA